MAKFGLFNGSSDKVLQEFEGDWLEVSGESVLVMVSDGTGNVRASHVIRMTPGWLVKKTDK